MVKNLKTVPTEHQATSQAVPGTQIPGFQPVVSCSACCVKARGQLCPQSQPHAEVSKNKPKHVYAEQLLLRDGEEGTSQRPYLDLRRLCPLRGSTRELRSLNFSQVLSLAGLE